MRSMPTAWLSSNKEEFAQPTSFGQHITLKELLLPSFGYAAQFGTDEYPFKSGTSICIQMLRFMHSSIFFWKLSFPYIDMSLASLGLAFQHCRS